MPFFVVPMPCVFSERVHEHVIREHDVSAIAHDEALRDPFTPAALEVVDLTEENREIDHHALADDALGSFAEDPARQEPHDHLFVTDDERVPRVRTTAPANDLIGELRVEVDDLSLTFIAPLGADNGHARHLTCPRSSGWSVR